MQNVHFRAHTPVRVHGGPKTPAFDTGGMPAAHSIHACVPRTKERSETTKAFTCHVPSGMRTRATADGHPPDHRLTGSVGRDYGLYRVIMHICDGARTAEGVSFANIECHLHLIGDVSTRSQIKITMR